MLPPETFYEIGIAGLALYILCDIFDEDVIPALKKKYFPKKNKEKDDKKN